MSARRNGQTGVSHGQRWYGYAGAAAAALFAALLVWQCAPVMLETAGYRIFLVPGASMMPTIRPGERIMVRMTEFSSAESPRRGELLVYAMNGSADAAAAESRVHRCVAVAGDKVEFKNGALYVNGRVEAGNGFQGRTYGFAFGAPLPEKVPDGAVCLLGDNRENAADSRVTGYVPLANVRGKALYKLRWPWQDKTGAGLLPVQ